MVVKRELKIKNCKKDFGLGPGVLARDELDYTGFPGSPMMMVANIMQMNEKLIHDFVEVEWEEAT